MNFKPPTISPTQPVFALIDLMIRRNVGGIIVVEDNQLVGIVTEKDILERVLKPSRNFYDTIVSDIMSKPLITVESNRTIKTALDILHEKNIRRLAVTENGVLIGITTERRLLEAAHSNYLMKSKHLEPKEVSAAETHGIPNISILSTFPPRECGIATYTSDLVESISQLQAMSTPLITAINDKGGYYDYPISVKLQIDREDVDTYREAAKIINGSGIDVVNIQHEFGLYGGVWGDYLIEFLKELEKPVVTTLHTILLEPPPDAERVTREILNYSKCVVVMAKVGIKILEQLYDTLPDKVRYIPHGCPNVPFVKSDAMKQFLGLEDRLVLSTFGLISSGKGIEYAIKAIPEIVEQDPRTLYLIIGETHPEVRKHEGESYRQSLHELVETLGIENNVRFVNRFLEKGDLIRFLQATDIYILPYPNREQISSGTLLYALSTGKAIVSTPFLHAGEVISQGAATECRFKDPASIASSVNNLIKFEAAREKYERRAYEYSREMIWPNVAMRYVNLFYECIGM
jgi:glycosyltransferase involved in cell wall biosynthesis